MNPFTRPPCVFQPPSGRAASIYTCPCQILGFVHRTLMSFTKRFFNGRHRRGAILYNMDDGGTVGLDEYRVHNLFITAFIPQDHLIS